MDMAGWDGSTPDAAAPARRRYLWVPAIVIVAVGLLASAEYVRQRQSALERDQEFAARTALAVADIGDRILTAGSTAVALIDPDGTVERARFIRWADTMIDQPGVLSVSRQERVIAGERSVFEAEIGRPIWERGPGGDPVPARDRPEFLPVVDAWPGLIADIVGFDLTSEAVRATAVRQARDLGSPVVSGPLALAPDFQTGVLVVVPLYRSDAALESVEQRRSAFLGTVTLGQFTGVLLDTLERSAAYVSLRDGNQLLAERGDPSAPGGAEAAVAVAEREWTVSTRHPRRESFTNLAWIVLGGTALAAVTAGWLRQVDRHAAQLRASRDELAAMVSGIQQGALRPPGRLPDGVEVAVRYEPAAQHARLGGDWYDLVLLEQGSLFIAVGDVSGHGLEAITHMQQVRQTISAFAIEGHGPATVLALADQVLQGEPFARGRLSTVWLGVLDAERGTLLCASAGHPAAVLSSPDGSSSVPPAASGPPLNTGTTATWSEHTVGLRGPARLLVYTDGVVESRPHGPEAGLAVADGLLGATGGSIDLAADLIMQRRPEPGVDDAALVVIAWGEDRQGNAVPSGVRPSNRETSPDPNRPDG
jgi:CHASE1-domain containing sensor protein